MTQTALVTGASSGIGEEIARQLCNRGYKVFAGARRVDKMTDLQELGATVIQLDVGSQESVDACFNIVSEQVEGGKLDLLFNNAGVIYGGPAIEVPFESIQNCFDVNVFGLIRMVQKFSKLIINAKGKIIQTGSATSLVPFVFGSTYATTKAAVLHYSNCLRVELAPFGVHVILLQLGTIDTGLGENLTVGEDSLYKDATESLEVASDFSSKLGAAEPQAAVKQILDSVLVSNPKPIIYAGSGYFLPWFNGHFMPTWWTDYALTSFFRLDKFAKRIAKKN